MVGQVKEEVVSLQAMKTYIRSRDMGLHLT